MIAKNKSSRLIAKSIPASQLMNGAIVNATFAPRVKNRTVATIIPINIAIPSNIPPIDLSVFIMRHLLPS